MKIKLLHIIFLTALLPSFLFSKVITFNCHYLNPTEYDVKSKESYKIYRKSNEDNFTYDTKAKKILSTSWHFSQLTDKNTKCTMDKKSLHCVLKKDESRKVELSVDFKTHKAEAHNTVSSSIHIHLMNGHCHRLN